MNTTARLWTEKLGSWNDSFVTSSFLNILKSYHGQLTLHPGLKGSGFPVSLFWSSRPSSPFYSAYLFCGHFVDPDSCANLPQHVLPSVLMWEAETVLNFYYIFPDNLSPSPCFHLHVGWYTPVWCHWQNLSLHTTSLTVSMRQAVLKDHPHVLETDGLPEMGIGWFCKKLGLPVQLMCSLTWQSSWNVSPNTGFQWLLHSNFETKLLWIIYMWPLFNHLLLLLER